MDRWAWLRALWLGWAAASCLSCLHWHVSSSLHAGGRGSTCALQAALSSLYALCMLACLSTLCVCRCPADLEEGSGGTQLSLAGRGLGPGASIGLVGPVSGPIVTHSQSVSFASASKFVGGVFDRWVWPRALWLGWSSHSLPVMPGWKGNESLHAWLSAVAGALRAAQKSLYALCLLACR